MPSTRWFVALAVTATASDVSPVEKVITLLEDLKEKSEDEGKAEAETYDTFACFCKDNTEEKSESVLDGQDNIEELSADIAEKTATKEDKITEIGNRKSSKKSWRQLWKQPKSASK